MSADTSALIDLARGVPALELLTASGPRLLVPVVAVGEFLSGLGESPSGQHQRAWLEGARDSLAVVPVMESDAAAYAGLFQQQRRAGLPVPINDLWIAALALRRGMPVLSNDRHFDRIAGVERVGW